MDIKEKEKQLAAIEAVRFLKDDMIVGLGTGSTAFYAIQETGRLVAQGLKIKCVSTSEKTSQLASSLNIPLIDINSIDAIDITIDGADEFTKDLSLIKGGGGALLREKIVATITKEEIIIADSSKLVEKLGLFKLPVEIVPFAYNYVTTQAGILGGKAVLRQVNNIPFVTDQGNHIIDVDFGLMDDPAGLSTQLNAIEGVVAHGLFIHLAKKLIMGKGEETISFTAA
ncbi:MAG: ribose-5-phosphate isomerase RpiA [Ferruginibacter sp.]